MHPGATPWTPTPPKSHPLITLPASSPHPAPTDTDWNIGLRRDTNGVTPPPPHETACEACPLRSGPAPRRTDTNRWATQHTAHTGHPTFRETTTVHLTVSPAPTSPLHGEHTRP
ncbi:DUF7848 domain-containing protein [Streptomyces tsukubensis]|uniref:DUF7848 domain-containing protein n=1 Tax=Streptomyces tsukubensis TaxID=83656 RepID=UPI003F8EA876